MHLYKKKPSQCPKNKAKYTFLWFAVDRDRKQIIDFEVGDRSFATYFQMVLRLQKKKIKYLCTDDYDAYKKVQIAEKHIITKAETAFVEAKNSSVRDNLARFNRRTKRFSKSLEMVNFTLILFIFWKNYGIINI